MKDLAMNKLTQKIRHFLRDEEGLTAIEYVVAGSVIVVVVAAAFNLFGTGLSNAMSTLTSKLTTGASSN
jgi:pilus assembly protein Flp/PilA